MYNHRPDPIPDLKGASSATRAERNCQDKKSLVEQGCSHGILVYEQGEPVGWCQYGLKQELPRIDNNPRYRKLTLGKSDRLWRITCFVVHKKYRGRGVARTALRAALDRIRGEGGGLAEAYPIMHWGAYQNYRGTVSMFEKKGFRAVAPLGESNILMRRTL